MSDKISAFPLLLAADAIDADSIPIVNGGATKRITLADLRSLAGGATFALQAGEVGVTSLLYPVGDVRRYGAVGDGATNDTTACQNAITSVHAQPYGGWVSFPIGRFLTSSVLTTYNNVSIRGEGIDQTALLCSTGNSGISLSCPTFDTNCGDIQDIQLFGPGVYPGTLTAPQQAACLTSVGLYLNNCANLTLRRVLIGNFGINIRVRDWDHLTLEGVRVGGYRGAGSFIAGDATAFGGSCQGLYASEFWASCGAGTNGLLDTGAAVTIDRAGGVTFVGGTIESGGVGMKIGATNTGADAASVGAVNLIGVDFENCAGQYVETGTAWVAAGYAVDGLKIDGGEATTSGSTTTTRGYVIKNTRGFICKHPSVALGTIGDVVFDFIGTNNRFAEIDPAVATGSLAGASWIRVNGTMQTDLVNSDRVFIGKTAFSDALGTNQDALRITSESGFVGLQFQNKGTAGGGYSFLSQSGQVAFFSNASSKTVIAMDSNGHISIAPGATNIGFYGVTPVSRNGAIAAPTAPSAAYVQAEATSMKTAVDAIRAALLRVGLIS